MAAVRGENGQFVEGHNVTQGMREAMSKAQKKRFEDGSLPKSAWKKGETTENGKKFKKGDVPWNKGKRVHMSKKCERCGDVFEKKITESVSQFKSRKYCGMTCTGKAAAEAGHLGNTGRTHFKKGHVPWNRGKELSEDHKKAMRAGGAGFKKGHKPWNKGKFGLNSGKDNPNWCGGTRDEYHKFMNSARWDRWRGAVFERDDYTCQMCGAQGGKMYDGAVYLEAHHLNGVTDLINNNMIEHIYNVDNGITLCIDCHRKGVHSNG